MIYAGAFLSAISAGYAASATSLLARVSDCLAYKHGARQEGLVSAIAISVSSSLTFAANEISSSLLQRSQSGTAAAGKTAYFLYAAVPCAIAVATLVLSLRFKLSEGQIDEMRLNSAEQEDC